MSSCRAIPGMSWSFVCSKKLLINLVFWPMYPQEVGGPFLIFWELRFIMLLGTSC